MLYTKLSNAAVKISLFLASLVYLLTTLRNLRTFIKSKKKGWLMPFVKKYHTKKILNGFKLPLVKRLQKQHLPQRLTNWLAMNLSSARKWRQFLSSVWPSLSAGEILSALVKIKKLAADEWRLSCLSPFESKLEIHGYTHHSNLRSAAQWPRLSHTAAGLSPVQVYLVQFHSYNKPLRLHIPGEGVCLYFSFLNAAVPVSAGEGGGGVADFWVLLRHLCQNSCADQTLEMGLASPGSSLVK